MNGQLKPYPKCKDSGVPWIGEVPEGWEILPNRALYYERKDLTSDPIPLLSVTIARGVIKQSDLIAKSSKKDSSNEDKSRYKVVYPGDITYNKMRMWQGAVGASHFNGIVSPAYIVMKPRSGLDPAFCHYLLRTPGCIKEAHRYSYGICDDQLSLRYEDFKQMSGPVPSKSEQRLIVRYLDYKNAKIDRYIHAKKRLVALLEEQKRVIIDEAVTGKIDVRTGKPYPKYVDSGVEWLGMVPEGWEVQRNARLFFELNETGRTDLPILSVSLRTGVTVGSEFDEDGRPRRLIIDQTKYKIAKRGDIVYNTMRMWQGAIGIAPVTGMVSPAYVVASPNGIAFSEYYVDLFSTNICKNEINRYSTGIVTDRNRLYWDRFKNLSMPVPSIREQKAISTYIKQATKNICDLQQKINSGLSKFNEFRSRLISDVVTGKLDVREAAASLPNLDAPEPAVDEDDFAEEDELDEELEEAAE